MKNDLPKSDSRIYRIWYDMKRRCRDKTRKDFENYGGRGITYSESWESFELFCNDMLAGYNDTLTLERVDVNSSYCKENCLWVSRKEQASNKRRYKNNILKHGNISKITNKGIPTIKARIQNPETGKRVCKFWSLNKYEECVAIELANSWVRDMRKFFGYAESHGE